MTFETAMERLGTLRRFGSPGAPERVDWILKRLGEPQRKLRLIHVAGTNGKGSTCAMLASVLQQAGYRTGLFISPYIVDFRERIQINGIMIPKEEFAGLMEQVFPYAEQLQSAGDHMSEFELLTVLALLWFSQRDCDVVVWEAGIGGKKDSTNVAACVPVTVLTSVSLDHTELLGDTIEEITRDKCGIMKPGGTMVLAPNQQDGVAPVVLEEAKKRDSRVVQACMEEIKVLRTDLHGTDFLYRASRFHLPLTGAHQLLNACTVLTVIEQLCKKGFCIAAEHIQQGLERVRFPARWEVMGEQPLVIIDGAHNPGGIDALKEAVMQYLPDRKITAIAGALQDKDTDYMTRSLSGMFAHVVTVAPAHPRALDAKVFAGLWLGYGQQACAAGDMEEALRKAKRLVGKNDVLLVFGSFFTAAEAREKLKYHFMEK